MSQSENEVTPINDLFNDAIEVIKDSDKDFSNEQLLKLYGLFKQGTVGDNTNDEPSSFNIKQHKKWKSWKSYKGVTLEDAKQQYIKFVVELIN